MDGAYNVGVAPNYAEPATFAKTAYAQQPTVNETGEFTPMQSIPPVQQVQPLQPVGATSFEPDDPIPSGNSEDQTEKKRRPRFVDFFMKKNNAEDK